MLIPAKKVVLCPLLLLTYLVQFSTSQYVNTHVQRTLNLTSHCFSTVDITFRSTASSANEPYLIAFPKKMYEKLAFINISLNGSPSLVQESKATRPDGYQVLAVPVNNIFSGKDQQEATVRIETIFTDVYEYLPTKIRQDENQMVVYSGIRVFASPYFTEKQKTTFSLASHHIEKVSEDESLVINGNNVTFGPYANVKAYASDSDIIGVNFLGETLLENEDGAPTTTPLRLHFENNFPFIFSKVLHTSINIFSDNRVSISTFADIKNNGANLDGGFSRLDHQMRRQDYIGPSFQQIRFNLLKSYHNVWCEDSIGNLTNAYVDHNDSSLKLGLRYPMFGGWTSDFFVKYDMTSVAELANSLTGSGGKKFLRFNLLPPIVGGTIERLDYTITFQNGFRGSKFKLMEGAFVDIDESYLDSNNHVVLKLKNKKQVFGVVNEKQRHVDIFYD